jgi:hypothetical protein
MPSDVHHGPVIAPHHFYRTKAEDRIRPDHTPAVPEEELTVISIKDHADLLFRSRDLGF